ncbi:uncharacterized protein LOC116020130 [Ipomoea triloba]|uniref:uncharacterized protein LOC116020130 n=1 Tax=Ipomoea triloba TaxID=35885 RepID=UPI00125D3932|nr:uncharacterized protein LOC116020130 [Ipomoea triloba]
MISTAPSTADVSGLIVRRPNPKPSTTYAYSETDFAAGEEDLSKNPHRRKRVSDLVKEVDIEALIAISVGFLVDSLTEEEIETGNIKVNQQTLECLFHDSQEWYYKIKLFGKITKSHGIGTLVFRFKTEDFNRPGEKVGYVLKRVGHTEASVDLAVLAGLDPVAVLCEVVDSDGSMARLPRLRQFA